MSIAKYVLGTVGLLGTSFLVGIGNVGAADNGGAENELPPVVRLSDFKDASELIRETEDISPLVDGKSKSSGKKGKKVAAFENGFTAVEAKAEPPTEEVEASEIATALADARERATNIPSPSDLLASQQEARPQEVSKQEERWVKSEGTRAESLTNEPVNEISQTEATETEATETNATETVERNAAEVNEPVQSEVAPKKRSRFAFWRRGKNLLRHKRRHNEEVEVDKNADADAKVAEVAEVATSEEPTGQEDVRPGLLADAQTRHLIETLSGTAEYQIKKDAKEELISLGEKGGRAVLPLLDSENRLTRILAISVLRETKAPEGYAAFLRLMDDADARIRFYAHMSLKNNVAQEHGYSFEAPRPERLAAIYRWTKALREKGLIANNVAVVEKPKSTEDEDFAAYLARTRTTLDAQGGKRDVIEQVIEDARAADRSGGTKGGVGEKKARKITPVSGFFDGLAQAFKPERVTPKITARKERISRLGRE